MAAIREVGSMLVANTAGRIKAVMLGRCESGPGLLRLIHI